MRKIILLFVAIASLVLVGCGGGSGASELESLIVGKKYYYLDKKDIQFSDGEKAYSIVELDFKENGKIVVTRTETKEQKSTMYKIDGNKLTILDDNGKADEVHIYDGKFDKGIKFKWGIAHSDKYEEEVLYYTKKDAEAEGEKYASGGGSGASELESLIVGKKYYYLYKKDKFSNGEKAYIIIELDFEENGKIVATETKTKKQKSGLYKIDDNKLIFLNDNGKADEVHIYDGKFDKGIKFKFKEDDSDKYKEEVFYYTKKDAEAEGEKYASECKVDGDTLLVAEGATCEYDDHTAICQDNKITVDGSLTGEKVTLNGTTYTCQ